MAMRLLAFLALLPVVAALPSCQKAQLPEKAPSASSSTVPSATATASAPPSPPPPGMVDVPAGSFTMGDVAGSPDARPPHKVTISRPFFIDETEVTVGEYAKCVAAGKCVPAGLHGEDVKSDELIKFRKLCNSLYDDRTNHPVNCVDQGQAAAYCGFVAKRLPTEAEWEYAARGPDGRTYPWGNDEPACLKAVVSGCTKVPKNRSGTQAVGSFPNGKSRVRRAGHGWQRLGVGLGRVEPRGVRARRPDGPRGEAHGRPWCTARRLMGLRAEPSQVYLSPQVQADERPRQHRLPLRARWHGPTTTISATGQAARLHRTVLPRVHHDRGSGLYSCEL